MEAATEATQAAAGAVEAAAGAAQAAAEPQTFQQIALAFGLKVLAAVVILVVGAYIAKLVRKLVERLLTKAKTDPTLVSFGGHFTHVLLMTFVVLAVLAKLGVQTTSFIAVIGAAGLAIGLALQGSLANFASGVLLIIFRPIRVDDFVEAAGVMGTVEEIQIFTTKLRSPDNKTVIIPNAKLTGDNIINYSAKGTRRVDMTAGVSYGADLKKVKSVIEEILAADERVLKEPAWKVAVLEMADSSVNFVVRPWVNAADYWDVYFDTMEKMKQRFDEEGIVIPFPQRDVHMYTHEE